MRVTNVGNVNNFLNKTTDLKNNNQKSERLNINFMQVKKDGVKEALQNQIMNVQKRIGEISENNSLSAEQKKKMKEDLQKQLEELNKQLIERDLQIKKEQEEKQEEKMKEKAEEKSYSTKEEQDTANLFKMANSLNQVKTQSAVRTKMKGNARVLESEIKLDESRGVDTTEKRKELSKINDRISKIEKRMGEQAKEINKEVKKNNKNEKSDDKKVDNKENDEKKLDDNSSDKVKSKHLDERI